MISSKKILFLDTTLHKKDATGITLSNLFGDFHKNNLYMIGVPTEIELSRESGYTNLFTLGENELKHRFPLGIIKSFFLKFGKNKKIKKQTFVQPNSNGVNLDNWDRLSLINVISSNLLRLFSVFGLRYYFLKIELSSNLENWIQDVDPDYLYVVLSTRHSIHFANQICDKYNIPLIVHIMDDWPRIIGKDTIFGNYWNTKVNIEFQNLLKRSAKQLAISKFMAEEYSVRFGGSWEYFHNPIDIERWLPFQKITSKNSLSKKVRIGYLGRIGNANKDTIIQFINSVDILNQMDSEFIIEFHVYTKQLLESVGTNKNIKWHSFVDYEKIPNVMSEFDFLLLPLSFSHADILFARLSIPTKLSEYLITGVPVLAIIPENTALNQFVSKNNCAFVINYNKPKEIVSKLIDVFNNPQEYSTISNTAKHIAMENFASNNILERFNKVFKNELK